MWEEILITDVTHMTSDVVCIAGINHKGITVRPLFKHPGIEDHYLRLRGQHLMRPRAVVEMNLEPIANCVIPHVEDCLWITPKKTKFLRYIDDQAFKSILKRQSKPNVVEIFGTEIHINKNIAPETGTNSLGTINPLSIQKFEYKIVKRGGVEIPDYRLSFVDWSGNIFESIKVNDLNLRCYVDFLHHHENFSMEEISAKLELDFQQSSICLRVGVTRPYEGWCWLQVTGIYTFPDYLKGKCFADFQ